MPSLRDVHQTIISCNECPRLRKYCLNVAEVKRRAFLSDTYWGKPVPGFGDENGRLMVVGLAPAAHGANRTGRVFTGDRSGEWLYRALHRAGFGNQPHSTGLNDGLRLQDAYINSVVRCAPPDNKPTPKEQETCISYLRREIKIMRQVKVWIALGQIAYQGLWPLIQQGMRRPKFAHGVEIQLPSNQWLILSYHPSQQNTFTGKLTEPMFDSVFSKARNYLNQVSSPYAPDSIS
jgi:uracil-DNA glycosylase family 4